MATAEERLNEWLRDAHAAEEQAHTMLTRTAGRIDSYPEFRARLEQHGELSERQADRLKDCLERRGESTSALKQAASKLTGLGQSISGVMASDEVVKAALATATFAHMEASSYKILVEAAEAANDPSTRQVCADLLAEEEEFEGWLDANLPALTAQYLSRESMGAAAKR